MDKFGLICFLASRNVMRYWKRGIQTFAIIFAGTLCIMLIDALMRGFSNQTASRIVALCGHMDVHAPGYLASIEASPLDISISDVEEVQRTLLSASSSLLAKRTQAISAAGISTAGMLSDGNASSPGGVYGTDPFALDAQGSRTILNPALKQAKDRLIEGRFFTRSDDTGAILDEKLARKLNLEPGRGIILIGTDAYGSFGMAEIPVIGICSEGNLPDGALCLTDLGSLQSALGMEGKASSLALWFGKNDPKGFSLLNPKAEKAAVNAALYAAASLGQDARPFTAISVGYTAIFDFLNFFMLAMMLIFALVAGAGMANAILLSVQDRTKDLGTLRAIALSSRGTGLLVAAETIIVGCLATACAFISGFLAVWIMERTGIAFVFEFASIGGPGLPDSLRPQLMPTRLGFIAIVCAVFPLISALLPIRIASKLTVREALAS